MESMINKQIPVIVKSVTQINDLVKRFVFVHRDGVALPVFSGGAHTIVQMKDGDTIRRNAYSLMSNPEETGEYSIAVRRDDEGRGGSLYMHRQVKEGMHMSISTPNNLFSLDLPASKHIMIAGGIGITPFMSQMAQLAATGGDFELHYGVRNPSLASFYDEILAKYGDRVKIYYSDNNEKLDLEKILNKQKVSTRIYTCGPKGMIEMVINTAKKVGWPRHGVHHEEFKAPEEGVAFDVELAISGKSIRVEPSQSLLEALEKANVEMSYLCRGGACGECETKVNQCDGTILHNDHWLDDSEKESKKVIMPCVSRFCGKKLVLDC